MFVCPECGQSSELAGHCTSDGTRLADGSADPLLGQTIGSYRIARLIGAGGMGAVYKGVQPTIGSRVAIKVLSHDPARSPALVERFFAEARAVNVIRHEHIVNVLDLSALPDGRPYIVMEYLDGEPLTQLLQRHGALPLGTLARMLCEVLEALGAAHAKGVVHRDLKPDNLFVTPNGHIKVLDFGIAKLRGEIATPGDATRTGALLGTPHYMSPEQALARPVDARTDVYAVGVIGFEAATGRRLFDAGSLYELLRLHLEQTPPRPCALRPDIPVAYEAAILRALEKDPARRFQSAAELAHALGQAAQALPPHAFARLNAGPGAIPSLGAASELPLSPILPPPAPIPPTYAGATIPVHGSLPAPSAKSSGAIWIGIGALVLLGVLGGLILMLGFWFTRSDDETLATPSPPAIPAPPGVATTSPFARPTPAPATQLDTKQFDVWKFFDEAERMAKQEQADARFVRLDATGIRPDGRIDLTLDQNHVLYRFRSASLSVPPAGYPENRTYEAKCIVYVYVDESGVKSYSAKWSCDWPFLPKPRCSPSQVWKSAAARGAPTGNLIANIGYWADDSGRGRWLLDISGRFTNFVPDAC
jgi:serine/threonine-protein kinase